MTNGDGVAEPPASLRLCTLDKWPNYNGYGFNLHDERGRPGHFIGSVEPASPAEIAGVHKDDQIYEVNGVSVRTADHHTVIEHVLEKPDQVELLVGHPSVGQYYLEHSDLWPHSLMPSVERMERSAQNPGKAVSRHHHNEQSPQRMPPPQPASPGCAKLTTNKQPGQVMELALVFWQLDGSLNGTLHHI